MGHLLHGEAAPWNHALQTPVPPWIQGLVCRVPGGAWLFTLSLPLQSPFTWPSSQYPLFKLSQLFACTARDFTRFFWHVQCMVQGSRALGWFNPLFFEPVGTSPHPAISLRKVGLLSSQSEPWVDATCSLKIEHTRSAENQALANHQCSVEHVLLHALVKHTIQLALQNTFSYTRYNRVFWPLLTSLYHHSNLTAAVLKWWWYLESLWVCYKDCSCSVVMVIPWVTVGLLQGLQLFCSDGDTLSHCGSVTRTAAVL